MKNHLKFIFNDMELELVHNIKYLGLIINFNGFFKLAITELKSQASRVMYAFIDDKCRKLDLPIDLQLELFDRMIVLIMLYGCEVWGPENYIETEKLHLKFFETHFRGTWKNY